MTKLYQYLVGLLIIFTFLSPVKSTAQEDAVLVVISNQEAKILLDGVEKRNS